MPNATIWMDLEGIMLSEIKSEKTNAACYHLHVESKKMKETSKYNKETDSQIQRTTVTSR